MAARSVSKVAPGAGAPGEEKDVEAEDTKAETAPLGPMPHAPTLHHLATREPHSFHQTTIYYGLVRQDTPPRRKYGLLAASIGIVFLQCFVASGLSVGVGMSSCRDSHDCSEGNFCDEGVCELCEPVIVVFLQRVKASRRKLKGACGGLGWGFVSFLAYLIWHTLMMEMNYQLAQGESSWTGE